VHGHTVVALHLRSIPKGIKSKERCELPPSLAMVQGHNSIGQDEDGEYLADSGQS
jgi:hypothetical protein